jgi:hypothetical protein
VDIEVGFQGAREKLGARKDFEIEEIDHKASIGFNTRVAIADTQVLTDPLRNFTRMDSTEPKIWVDLKAAHPLRTVRKQTEETCTEEDLTEAASEIWNQRMALCAKSIIPLLDNPTVCAKHEMPKIEEEIDEDSIEPPEPDEPDDMCTRREPRAPGIPNIPHSPSLERSDNPNPDRTQWKPDDRLRWTVELDHRTAWMWERRDTDEHGIIRMAERY